MLNTLLAQSRTPVGVAGLPPIVAAVCHVSISVFHVRSTNRPKLESRDSPDPPNLVPGERLYAGMACDGMAGDGFIPDSCHLLHSHVFRTELYV